MTLHQLEYIIAIDRYRSFAEAAAELGVTQPTLSSLLQKLEAELGVRIFERTNKSVRPTEIGVKILRQAEKTVAEAGRIAELVAGEKSCMAGRLDISVGPTVAPYILPRFIREYTRSYPQVRLSIAEMKADAMLEAVYRGELDAGIATAGRTREGIREIHLYTEPFMVYIAESCWRKMPVFRPENLEHEQMWVMRESQCLRDSAFSFCKAQGKGKRIYEAGSIATLVDIVDENGGFTIIPEMHVPMLSERQRRNVRRIDGDYLSQRRVSMYIREDYVRRRMLDSITDVLFAVVPRGIMKERVKF